MKSNKLFVLYRERGNPAYLTEFISEARGGIHSGNLEDALLFTNTSDAQEIAKHLSSDWQIITLATGIVNVERMAYKIGNEKR